MTLNPKKSLMILCATQLLLWTALPTLFFSAPPLDVVENLLWGQEWQWGYYKHPPMQAWLSELAVTLSGGHIFGLYLLAQMSVVVIYLVLFDLGRMLKNEQVGLLAAGSYALVYYASIPTPEFNANSVLALFSALAVWYFYRALEHDRLINWLLLALFLAASAYAKYAALFIFLAMFFVLLAYQPYRAALCAKNFWLSAMLCLVLLIPHFMWLVQNDFLPFTYAASRGAPIQGVERFILPLKFLITQVLDHALVIIILLFFIPVLRKPQLEARQRLFLYALAFLPLTLLAGIAGLFGMALKDMWGYGLVTFIALFIGLCAQDLCQHKRFVLLQKIVLAILILLPLLYIGLTTAQPYFGQKPIRAAWPAAQINQELQAVWKEHQSSAAPELVAGPTWEAGLASYVLPDRPQALVLKANAKACSGFENNPWVTQKIFNSKPVLFVWSGAAQRFQGCGAFSAQGLITVKKGSYDFVINWAIRDAKLP